MRQWPLQTSLTASAVQGVAGQGWPGHAAHPAPGEAGGGGGTGRQRQVRLTAAARAWSGVHCAAQSGRQPGPPAGDWHIIWGKIEDDFHHWAMTKKLKFTNQTLKTPKFVCSKLKIVLFSIHFLKQKDFPGGNQFSLMWFNFVWKQFTFYRNGKGTNES